MTKGLGNLKKNLNGFGSDYPARFKINQTDKYKGPVSEFGHPCKNFK